MRRRRPRRRTAWPWLGAACALLVLGGVGAAAWGWRLLSEPHAGWTGTQTLVQIPKGASAGAMLDSLAGAGVLRRPRLVRAWLAVAGGSEALKAGEYRFDQPVTPLEVLAKLRRGAVVLHPVTLPEGLHVRETAQRLAAAGLGPQERFLELFRDPAPILDLDPEASDLEGYLYPDTYYFPRGETPDSVVAALVTRFRQATGEGFLDEVRAAGLTLRETVTLASLIEEETSLPQERPRIARVFHNRLDRGMRLQCDPTVLYALMRAGQRVGQLSTKHLRFESPFNTYVTAGLPPGPICNPGLASLQAAVRPSPGEEIFFVAAPGGGHTFSSNLASHNAAVRQLRAYARSSR
jgi:UPF0755 protein